MIHFRLRWSALFLAGLAVAASAGCEDRSSDGSQPPAAATVMTVPTLGPTAIVNTGEGPTSLSTPGPCNAASFEIVSGTPFGQALPPAEDISITIEYEAPGCSRVGGFLSGRHVPGSPWFEHFCGATSSFGYPCVKTKSLSSNYNVDADLPTPAGSINLVGVPDPEDPPTNVATDPSVEGFVLCGVILTFFEGPTRDGSAYYYEIDFEQAGGPCDEPF